MTVVHLLFHCRVAGTKGYAGYAEWEAGWGSLNGLLERMPRRGNSDELVNRNRVKPRFFPIEPRLESHFGDPKQPYVARLHQSFVDGKVSPLPHVAGFEFLTHESASWAIVTPAGQYLETEPLTRRHLQGLRKWQIPTEISPDVGNAPRWRRR